MFVLGPRHASAEWLRCGEAYRPWGQELSLVTVTGWGHEGDRRCSQEAGFDLHLVKPSSLRH